MQQSIPTPVQQLFSNPVLSIPEAGPESSPEVSPKPGPKTAAPPPETPTADRLCSNPACDHPPTRWVPGAAPRAFAGQVPCSPGCLEALLRAALARENALSTEAALRTGPRVRIGQILVQQGVISEAQLSRALQSQRLTGAGRLGTWLRQQTELAEEDFAAALGIQWQCPVFKVGAFAPERMSVFLPKPLAEAFGALPLRHSREPERLTICFEDSLDAELIRACERMHGIPVEGGLMTSGDFWYCSGELLKASFPPARVVEARSLDGMIDAMTETLVRASVVDAHLVYVHGYYWLRMWVPGPDAPSPRDILCTVRLSSDQAPESQLSEEMAFDLAPGQVS